MTQAPCKKCGFDEAKYTCPYCGSMKSVGTLGNFGGRLLTICCQTDPTKPPTATKTPRGGK